MLIYNKSLPYADRLIKKNLNKGSLLDVGGAELPSRAESLAEILDSVTIMDIKKPERKSGKKISFIKASIENTPDEGLKGKFDNILLSNVLEHLNHPGGALANCREMLGSGGKLHILSPNCESLNRRIGVLMGEMDNLRYIPETEKAMGHVRTLTVDDIRDFLENAGLKIEIRRGLFLKPVPTYEMIKWPGKRIDAFFRIASELPPELCHEVYFMARKA
jgi:2-polyprenyl-6-hydroxyphenyl methylase/3-demethylubiquinone-9 3-methyltransferase